MHIQSCSSYRAASGCLFPGQDPGRALLMPTQDALRRGLRMLRARASGLPVLSRRIGTRHCSRHGPLPLGGGQFNALPPERAGSSRPRPQPTGPQQFKAWIYHELGGGILETVLALVSIAVTLGGIAVTLVVRRAQATGVLPVIGSFDSGPHLVHTAAPKSHTSELTAGSRSTPSAEAVAVEARDERAGAGADRPAAAVDTVLPYGASPADDAFDTPWSDLSRWAICCMQYQEALAEQAAAAAEANTAAAATTTASAALPTVALDDSPGPATPATTTTTTVSKGQRHRHRQQAPTSTLAGGDAAAAAAAAPNPTQPAAGPGAGGAGAGAGGARGHAPALIRGARAALRLTGQVAELPLRVVDWALQVDQPVRVSAARVRAREGDPAVTASTPATTVAEAPPSAATSAEPPAATPLPISASAPPSTAASASPSATAIDTAGVDANAVTSPNNVDGNVRPQLLASSQTEAIELKPSIAATTPPPPPASEPAAAARRWAGDLEAVPPAVSATADRVVHVVRDAATGVRGAAAAAADAAAAQLSMYGKGPSASAPPAVSQLPGGAATAVFALALSSWLSAWAVVLLGRAAARVLGRMAGGKVAAAAKGRDMNPREYFGPWYDVVQQMGPARTCVPLCTPPPPPLQLPPQRPSLLTAAAAAAAVATPPVSTPAEAPKSEAAAAAEVVTPKPAVSKAGATASADAVVKAATAGPAGGHDLAAADKMDSNAELLRLKPPPASRSGWHTSAAAVAGLKPNPRVLPDLSNGPGLTAASLAAATAILSDDEVRALRRWAANNVVAPRQRGGGGDVVRQSDGAAVSNAEAAGASQGEGCEDGDEGDVELSRLLFAESARSEETFGGRSGDAEDRPGLRPRRRDAGAAGEPLTGGGGGDAAALDGGAGPRARQERCQRRLADLKASRAAKRAAAADPGATEVLGPGTPELPMKDAAASVARSQPETELDARGAAAAEAGDAGDGVHWQRGPACELAVPLAVPLVPGLDARGSKVDTAAAPKAGGAGDGEGEHWRRGPACELAVPLAAPFAVPVAVPVPPVTPPPLAASELAPPPPSAPSRPPAPEAAATVASGAEQRREVEPAAPAGAEPRTAPSSAGAGASAAAAGAIVMSTLSMAGLQVSTTISQPGTALVIRYQPPTTTDSALADAGADADATSTTAEAVGDVPPVRPRMVGSGEQDSGSPVREASEADAHAEGGEGTGTDAEVFWHQRPGYDSPESRMYYQRLQRSELQSPGNATVGPLPATAAAAEEEEAEAEAEAPSEVGELVVLRDNLMPVVVRPEEKRIVVATPAAPAPAVEGNGGNSSLASARRTHGQGPTRGSLHSQTVTVTIDADGGSSFNTVHVDLVPAATPPLPAAPALQAPVAALPGGVSEPLALAAPASSSVAALPGGVSEPLALAAAVTAIVDVAADAAAAAAVEAVTEVVVDLAVVTDEAVVAAVADAAAAAAATAAFKFVKEIGAAGDATVEAAAEPAAAGTEARAESQAPPAAATATSPPEQAFPPAPTPGHRDNWAFYAGQYNGMVASELLPYGQDGKALEPPAGRPPSGAPSAPAVAAGGPVACWSWPVGAPDVEAEDVEAGDVEAGDVEVGAASVAAASPAVEPAAADATAVDGPATDTAAAAMAPAASAEVDSAPAPAAAGGERVRVPSGRARFARYTGVPELDRLGAGTDITPGSWAATGSVRMGRRALRVSDGTAAAAAAAKKHSADGPSPEVAVEEAVAEVVAEAVAVAEAAPRPHGVVRRSSFRTRAALLRLRSDQVRSAAAAAATAAGAAAAATLNGVRLEELFSGGEAAAAATADAVAAATPADVIAPPATVAPSAATATATAIPSPVTAAATSGATRGFAAAETTSGPAAAAAAAPPAASIATGDVAAAAAAVPLMAVIATSPAAAAVAAVVSTALAAASGAAPVAAAVPVSGGPPPDVLALEDEDVAELAALAAAASGAATAAVLSPAFAPPALAPPSDAAAAAPAAAAAASPTLAAAAAPAVAAVPTSEDQATDILVLEDKDVEELAVLAAAASGAATVATAATAPVPASAVSDAVSAAVTAALAALEVADSGAAAAAPVPAPLPRSSSAAAAAAATSSTYVAEERAGAEVGGTAPSEDAEEVRHPEPPPALAVAAAAYISPEAIEPGLSAVVARSIATPPELVLLDGTSALLQWARKNVPPGVLGLGLVAIAEAAIAAAPPEVLDDGVMWLSGAVRYTASDFEEEQQMALAEDTELSEEAEDGSDGDSWSACRLPLPHLKVVDDGAEEKEGGGDGSVGAEERPLSKADVIVESAVRVPPSWVSPMAQAAMAPVPGRGVEPSTFADVEPSSDAITGGNGVAAAVTMAAAASSSSFSSAVPIAAEGLVSGFNIGAPAAAEASGEAEEDEDEEAILGWLVDVYGEISSDEEDDEGQTMEVVDGQTAGAATAAAAAAVAAAGAARSASLPGGAATAPPGGADSQAAVADGTAGVMTPPVSPAAVAAAAVDADVRLPASYLARGSHVVVEEEEEKGQDAEFTLAFMYDDDDDEEEDGKDEEVRAGGRVEDGTTGVIRDLLLSGEADGGGDASEEDQAVKLDGDRVDGVDGASVPMQGLFSRGGDSEEEDEEEEHQGASRVLRGVFVDIWADDDDSEGEAEEGAEGEGKAAKSAGVGELSALLGSCMIDEEEGEEQQQQEEEEDLDSFGWDFYYNDDDDDDEEELEEAD